MTLLRNLLFWIVLALLGAVLAHFFFAQDPGYVLVRWRGHDYTTTLLYATWIVLGVALLLWIAWSLLTWPFRAWSLHRDRQQRARIGDGIEALHQGRYAQAERLLAGATDDPDLEAAARLSAAEAALARGDEARARAQLDAFGDRHPASRAIALATIALRDHRPTDALVALDAPAAQPLPPRGLALRAEALAQAGQATEAYGLLGALRKQDAWSDAELTDRELRWAAASLREGDENAFAQHWEALPKPLKHEPAVVAAYATRAAELGWDEAATRSLERALEARWDERLATLYGRLPVGRLEHRRAQAERWLAAHPGSLALPAILARLAHAQGDAAAADAYWRQALAEGGSAEDWEALGDACAARGDEAAARQCYANALRVARGDRAVPWLPGAPPAAGPVHATAHAAPGLPAVEPLAVEPFEQDIDRRDRP